MAAGFQLPMYSGTIINSLHLAGWQLSSSSSVWRYKEQFVLFPRLGVLAPALTRGFAKNAS